MKLPNFFIIINIIILCYSCLNNNNQKQAEKIIKKDTISQILSDTTILEGNDGYEHENPSDTFKNGNNWYVLKATKKVTNNDIDCYFEVFKKEKGNYRRILKDFGYSTNNSSLFLNDVNKDGYFDIIWEKKWQEHAYLFNPSRDNFIEVGELHDIDTLKINGKVILHKEKFPVLYLSNEEKEFDWMIELHSELFIIDDNFNKISFATLDNMATLDDKSFHSCMDNQSVIINCYVPPYKGLFSDISIWNKGKSIFREEINGKQFNKEYIIKYWTQNYQKLLQYGKVFKVRREKPLKYYN